MVKQAKHRARRHRVKTLVPTTSLHLAHEAHDHVLCAGMPAAQQLQQWRKALSLHGQMLRQHHGGGLRVMNAQQASLSAHLAADDLQGLLQVQRRCLCRQQQCDAAHTWQPLQGSCQLLSRGLDYCSSPATAGSAWCWNQRDAQLGAQRGQGMGPLAAGAARCQDICAAQLCTRGLQAGRRADNMHMATTSSLVLSWQEGRQLQAVLFAHQLVRAGKPTLQGRQEGKLLTLKSSGGRSAIMTHTSQPLGAVVGQGATGWSSLISMQGAFCA